jgi:hypothetical protein
MALACRALDPHGDPGSQPAALLAAVDGHLVPHRPLAELDAGALARAGETARAFVAVTITPPDALVTAIAADAGALVARPRIAVGNGVAACGQPQSTTTRPCKTIGKLVSVRRRFVESRGFSEDRKRLERAREFSHDDMVALEQSILADPEVGDLVGYWRLAEGPSCAARARARQTGRGARLYLDLPGRGVTHLVAIFGKRAKSDLSRAERKVVAALVRQLKEQS